MARTYIKRMLSQEVTKRIGNDPTVVEDVFTIPDGKTITIERFYGGHEDAETEVRVELIERIGSTDSVVYVGYATNFDIRDVESFVGDGSRKLVLRLINGDNGALHMTGVWRGIYDG